MTPTTSLAPVCIASMSLVVVSAGEAPAYELVNLQTLPSNSSYPTAVNSWGEVVGWRHPVPSQPSWYAPFYHDGSSMVDLGFIYTTYSVARAINDDGVIVGNSEGPGLKQTAWILQDAVQPLPLPNPDANSGARGINDAGDAVGYYWLDGGGYRHAIAWLSGSVVDLGSLGDDYQDAYDINNSASIVGRADVNSASHAFLWTLATGMVDLGPGEARAINDFGQVIGESDAGGFLWTPDQDNGTVGVRTELGPFIPYGINSSGEMVGTIDGLFQAAYVSPIDGQVVNLNDLIEPGSGWTLRYATAIAGCGRIVGWGTLGGSNTAFMLVPTDAPQPGAGESIGFVFSPDPITASGDDSLSELSPPSLLNALRSCVALQGLDGSGFLNGELVSTSASDSIIRLFSADGVFDASATESGLAEVTAYHHCDQAERYLLSILPNLLSDSPLLIDVNTAGEAPAYSASLRTIFLGDTGVDDGQDGEIVLHEHGHDIMSRMLPPLSPNPSYEYKVLAEGFSDYWAASYFAGSGPSGIETFGDEEVVMWGIQERFPRGSNSLRRLDFERTYEDIARWQQSGSCDRGHEHGHFEQSDPCDKRHQHGQVWSRALWEISQLTGKRAADQIILTALKDTRSDTTLEVAARLILDSSVTLTGGLLENDIRGIFLDRKLLIDIQGLSLAVAPAADGDGQATIEATLLMSGPVSPRGATVEITVLTGDGVTAPSEVDVPAFAKTSTFQMSISCDGWAQTESPVMIEARYFDRRVVAAISAQSVGAACR